MRKKDIENGAVRHPMARSRDDVILAHIHISMLSSDEE
jgi:hypothetical protein